MKFKEVAHLYIGCTIEHDALGTGQLTPQWLNDIAYSQSPPTKLIEDEDADFEWKLIKPLLKPVSSITDEEIKELWSVLELNPEYENDDAYPGMSMRKYLNDFFSEKERFPHRYECFGWSKMPTLVNWLLKNGFDIFGLIESGQATKK